MNFLFVYSVEIYDPVKDKWEEGVPLTSGRSGHASAVIYQPSCPNQYLDFIDEPIKKNKKPPNADDDDNTRGPSTSKTGSHSRSSSNKLHAFSGNRCSNCDDTAKATDHVDQEHKNKRTQKLCESEQSNYEIGCRNAIHNLLQMDCDMVVPSPEQNENFDMSGDDTTMDIPDDEEQPIQHNFNDYRRRMSYELEDSGMSENSNSQDSLSPNSMYQPEFKTDNNNHGQCSFSKLKRRVRKNISNFVTWSSAPKLNQSYDINASPSIESNNNDRTAYSDRKKYYKCKLKS